MLAQHCSFLSTGDGMVQPSHTDLGIEIGKAIAMAEMAQQTIKGVEKHLTDRVDRFEQKVDGKFTDLENRFDSAVGEIKQMITDQHREITDIKLQKSHDEGEKHNKEESKSKWLAFLAIVISLIGAIANLFSGHFK